jgi:hypothetical protein
VKCIQCATDSKKKDRSGGRCPKCGEPFAFDPTTGEPSDPAFQHWIDRVGGKGQVKFTPTHLYYEARRASWKAIPGRRSQLARRLGCLAAFGVLGPLVLIPFTGGLSVILSLCNLVIMAVMALNGAAITVLDRDGFDSLYRKWTAAHGPIAGLAATPKIPAARRVDPTELEAYSFDRAVITDNPAIVDVLVANRFHFENNCAVLSIDGHPAGAFEQVRRMLRNNPRIEVFAVHDATPDGCTLAHRLRNDPAWFQGIGRVFDVGLRPIHAQYFKFAVVHETRTVAPHPARSPAEDAWLAAHRLELAAIRPEQLVKRLFRAMTHQPEQEEKDDEPEPTLFGTDAGTSDGGADSFG